MKWSEFKASVLPLLTVDSQRLGIETYIDRLIRLAVDEIQFYIPKYREGFVKVYHSDDVTPDGEASRGQIPAHAFLRQWELVSTADNGGRLPLSYWPYSNLADMQNRRATGIRPAHYTVDPRNRQFWVVPRLTERHIVRLTYDLKSASTLEDEDETPLTDDVSLVVAEFVKWKITREVDRNLKIAADYQFSYVNGRTKLYLQAKEEQGERTTPSPATAPVDICLPVPIVSSSCGGYAAQDSGTVLPYFPCCCPCPPRTPPGDLVILFGDSGQSWDLIATEQVSELVNAANPDVVIHLGDASYPVGNMPGGYDTLIPENFLQFYFNQHREHLFLAMGNHDLEWEYGRKFVDRMPKLAEAIRLQHGTDGYTNGWWWYSIQQQYVTFFVLNSGRFENDVFIKLEEQKTWLQSSLAQSGTPWNVVVLHRAPYTSDASHAPGDEDFRLPYKEWGADLVISAHGHSYERLRVDGLDYLVCGTGGGELRDKSANSVDLPKDSEDKPVSITFQKRFGYLSLNATETRLHTEFIAVGSERSLDRLRLVQ